VYHAYCLNPERGTLREVFAIQALSLIAQSSIALPKSGDIHFSQNDKHYIFEIGGKQKSSRQIMNQSNGFVLVDDMIGDQKKVPLWLL
jgi:uncharacterized protein